MKNIFTNFVAVAILLICFSFALSPIGLKVGDTAPDFEGMGQKNKTFKLSEALKKGPVVVFFYRGEWCPFCNRYISNIQDSMYTIRAKGASVVGISTESPEGVKTTIYKTGAKFPVLHDKDGKICKDYLTLETGSTPIPATYIIGADGKVKFVHFDKNYQKRPTVQEILANL